MRKRVANIVAILAVSFGAIISKAASEPSGIQTVQYAKCPKGFEKRPARLCAGGPVDYATMAGASLSAIDKEWHDIDEGEQEQPAFGMAVGRLFQHPVVEAAQHGRGA